MTVVSWTLLLYQQGSPERNSSCTSESWCTRLITGLQDIFECALRNSFILIFAMRWLCFNSRKECSSEDKQVFNTKLTWKSSGKFSISKQNILIFSLFGNNCNGNAQNKAFFHFGTFYFTPSCP